jgi:uncharacterized membrane protein YbhN (UPF0104 family)
VHRASFKAAKLKAAMAAISSRKFWSRLLAALAALAILLGALFILHRQFQTISLAALVEAIREQSALHVATALALTVISFTALAAYDIFASHIVAPGRVGAGRAALAGAAGNAVANTLGFHALTGSVVRYRIYRRAGIGVADTARIISLSWAALGLGFATMLSAALLVEPLLGGDWRAADWRLPAAGLALALALASLVVWLSRNPQRLALGRFHLTMPPPRLAVWQMAIGAVEMGAALGALYVLLPADLAPSFATFAIAAIVSILLGVAAHAPGGIGVFEAAIVSLLGGAGRADLLAALLLYRLIYNVLPFVLSLLALGLFEIAAARSSSSADSGE